MNKEQEETKEIIKTFEDQLLAESHLLEAKTERYNYLSKLDTNEFIVNNPNYNHEGSKEFAENVKKYKLATLESEMAKSKERIIGLNSSIDRLKDSIKENE